MSHFSRLRTEIRSIEALAKAISRQGMSHQFGGQITDYYGAVQNVDLRVRLDERHEVGFLRNSETGVLELVGDWYQTGTTQEQFIETLRLNYAREEVVASLERQGLDISKVRETEQSDGTVVFELDLDDQDMGLLMMNQ